MGNIPYGSCVICLEKFEESDSFLKTDCYHYFHSNCLLRYIEHSLQEIKEYQKQMVRHLEQEEKQVHFRFIPKHLTNVSFDKILKEPESINTLLWIITYFKQVL